MLPEKNSLSWHCLSNQENDYAVYYNIPYCKTPCSFCHYIPNIKLRYSSVPSSYIQMLIKQTRDVLAYAIPYRHAVSCYIGGGTPSLLNPEQLNSLFQVMDEYIKGFDEVCIEIHPSDWNAEYIDLGRITRFSLGIQTFNQQRLGRVIIQVRRMTEAAQYIAPKKL